MKSIISKSIALVAVAATMLSFSTVGSGGEGFEIALNNKVVIQKYGPNINEANSLKLDAASLNEQLSVRYHHCGKVGKNRVISIKDVQDKIVKEWRYADASVPVAAMSCNVKEILDLKKTGSFFKMYYSSSELPNGRLLTNIVLGDNRMVKK